MLCSANKIQLKKGWIQLAKHVWNSSRNCTILLLAHCLNIILAGTFKIVDGGKPTWAMPYDVTFSCYKRPGLLNIFGMVSALAGGAPVPGANVDLHIISSGSRSTSSTSSSDDTLTNPAEIVPGPVLVGAGITDANGVVHFPQNSSQVFSLQTQPHHSILHCQCVCALFGCCTETTATATGCLLKSSLWQIVERNTRCQCFWCKSSLQFPGFMYCCFRWHSLL